MGTGILLGNCITIQGQLGSTARIYWDVDCDCCGFTQAIIMRRDQGDGIGAGKSKGIYSEPFIGTAAWISLQTNAVPFIGHKYSQATPVFNPQIDTDWYFGTRTFIQYLPFPVESVYPEESFYMVARKGASCPWVISNKLRVVFAGSLDPPQIYHYVRDWNSTDPP